MQVEPSSCGIRAADDSAELLRSSPDCSSAVTSSIMHQSHIKIYNVTDSRRCIRAHINLIRTANKSKKTSAAVLGFSSRIRRVIRLSLINIPSC